MDYLRTDYREPHRDRARHLHTTASDYGLRPVWVARREGLDGALAADREAVHPSTRSKLCPPERRSACPDEVGWGLGWDVAAFGSRRMLWHTGVDRGEFAFACVIPATGEGIVILTSSAVGHAVVLPIRELVGAAPRFVAFLREQAGAAG